MKFDYRYRANDGSLKNGTVEAASRDVAYQELRKQGITPISIAEGSGEKAKSPKINKTLIGALCILGLVAIVVVATMTATGKKPVSSTRTASSEKSKKAVKPVKKTVATEATNVVGEVVKPALKPQAAEDLKDVELSSDSNKVDVVLEEAHRMTSNAVFKTKIDQLLVIALSGSERKGMPPLPPIRITEKEFRDSLATKIEILDTDSDEIKELKRAVIEARAEMLEQVNKGRTVQEVLQEHAKLRNENNKTRRDAQLELNAIYSSGDVEGAKKYYERMNAELEKIGVPKLRMPLSPEEKEKAYEERKQRAEERRRLREAAAKDDSTKKQ